MTGFIIYFTLLSIVHLFFCYFGMHTPRKLTKPPTVIMPFTANIPPISPTVA